MTTLPTTRRGAGDLGRPGAMPSRRSLLLGGAALSAGMLGGVPLSAAAQGYQQNRNFSQNELVNSGHQFFGNVSRGLALTIEEAVRRWGEPNGYVLGQEASGAFIGGLRYGEGTLFTRNAGDREGLLGRGLRSASMPAARARGR